MIEFDISACISTMGQRLDTFVIMIIIKNNCNTNGEDCFGMGYSKSQQSVHYEDGVNSTVEGLWVF